MDKSQRRHSAENVKARSQSSGHQPDDLAETDLNRKWQQSPRMNFRKEVIFENVSGPPAVPALRTTAGKSVTLPNVSTCSGNNALREWGIEPATSNRATIPMEIVKQRPETGASDGTISSQSDRGSVSDSSAIPPTKANQQRRVWNDSAGSYSKQSPAAPKRRSSETRTLLETDLDEIFDDSAAPPRPRAGSAGAALVNSGGPAAAGNEVLWEFSGRKLSNFCQTLITECDRLEGETAGMETCVDDIDLGEFSVTPSGKDALGLDPCSRKYPTEINTPAIGLDVHPTSGTIFSGNKAVSLPGPIAASASKTSGSFDIDSLLSSPSRVGGRLELTTQIGGHCEPPVSGDSKISGIDHNRNENTGNGLTEGPTSGVSDSGIDVGNRSVARRGRTMERSKYDASLLKDFIRPEHRKFSLAPSHDLNLDTELAIWEPSDFLPDRHMSAPPADLSMKVAKSEDLLLRSRQGSVSPLRQRLQGPRWFKGSKSVELLSSRHSSPSNAKIRRRALSKEWQIITLTTREEITTMIRPKTTGNGTRGDHREISRFSNKDLNDEVHTTSIKSLRDLGIDNTVISALRSDRDPGAEKLISNAGVPNSVRQSHLEGAQRKQSADYFSLNTTNGTGEGGQKSKEGVSENKSTTPSYTNTYGKSPQLIPSHDGVNFAGSDDQTKGTSDRTTKYTRNTEVSTNLPSNTGCIDDTQKFTAILAEGLSHSETGDDSDFDENKAWDVISEALSGMMKDVELVEDENSNWKGRVTENEDTSRPGFKTEAYPENGSLSGKSDDMFGSKNRPAQPGKQSGTGGINIEDGDLDSSKSTDIDELVQALLEFANEGDDSIGNISPALTAGQFLTGGRSNGLHSNPPETGIEASQNLRSGRKPTQPDQGRTASSTGTDNTHSSKKSGTHKSQQLGMISDNTVLRSGSWNTSQEGCVRTGASEPTHAVDQRKPKTATEILPSLNIEELAVQSDCESVLEIREDSDTSGYKNSAAKSTEHIPTDELNTTLDRTDSSSQGDAETTTTTMAARQRLPLRQEDPPEVTQSRRHSDSNEVFPEKAFLESLVSSLGTIIFLLLAALIFHVLSRIVEHEL